MHFIVSFSCFDSKWKSSHSLTVANHSVVKRAFTYNARYIWRDLTYTAALVFLVSMQEKSFT